MKDPIELNVETAPSHFGDWLRVPLPNKENVIFLFRIYPHKGGREYVGTLLPHQLYTKDLPKLLEGCPVGTELVVIPARVEDFLTVATVQKRKEGELA